MQRILVGVDGSTASRRALHWAADVAGRAGLELVAVGVVGSTHDGARRELSEELERWCAGLPARCARRRAMLSEGEPGPTLLQTAVDEEADLMAVASRGTGEVAGVHLGSVAHYLAHATAIPLAIVAPEAMVTTTRLVVGHDPRTGSPAALAFTAELARRMGVPVTAVYNFDPGSDMDMAASVEEWHRQAVAEVHGWTGPIEEAGVAVDCYVDHDRDVDPVAALEYVLLDHPGAAAVVGVHGPDGHGVVRVPFSLVRHAHRAVILVPASFAAASSAPTAQGTGSHAR